MSDIEILGRPLYLPIKHKLQDEQSSLVQIKSKQSKSTLTYTDIEYERDEKDWWWCEDI
jgi:hypothetical protein